MPWDAWRTGFLPGTVFSRAGPRCRSPSSTCRPLRSHLRAGPTSTFHNSWSAPSWLAWRRRQNGGPPMRRTWPTVWPAATWRRAGTSNVPAAGGTRTFRPARPRAWIPRRRPARRDGVNAPGLAVIGLAAVLDGVSARTTPRQQILEAMRESRGYDLTATTNGARFQSEVLRQLARRAQASDPSRSPLFIDHRDWFGAYLDRTGLAAEAAPPFVRLGRDYGQDMVVDYRPEKVLDATEPGPRPAIALNVCIWWPEDSGRPGNYSYEDLLSKPRLKG